MTDEGFDKILRERGLRVTAERAAVIGEIARSGHHFTAEALHDALRGKGHRVSRASVYRTLSLLRSAGIIAEVESTRGDKSASFEYVHGKGHHDHMLCLGCGKAIEFYSEALEKLQDRMCREHAFEGVTHTLEIRGYCPRCRKKRQSATAT